MQSDAPDVDTYLKTVPIERRTCLIAIRDLCVKTLEGYTEAMGYGMPGYSKDGVGEVGFASQKHFIALYILKVPVMEAFRAELKQPGISMGKGCIRYSKPEKVDLGLVERMLRATAESDAVVC